MKDALTELAPPGQRFEKRGSPILQEEIPKEERCDDPVAHVQLHPQTLRQMSSNCTVMYRKKKATKQNKTKQKIGIFLFDDSPAFVW